MVWEKTCRIHSEWNSTEKLCASCWCTECTKSSAALHQPSSSRSHVCSVAFVLVPGTVFSETSSQDPLSVSLVIWYGVTGSTFRAFHKFLEDLFFQNLVVHDVRLPCVFSVLKPFTFFSSFFFFSLMVWVFFWVDCWKWYPPAWVSGIFCKEQKLKLWFTGRWGCGQPGQKMEGVAGG